MAPCPAHYAIVAVGLGDVERSMNHWSAVINSARVEGRHWSEGCKDRGTWNDRCLEPHYVCIWDISMNSQASGCFSSTTYVWLLRCSSRLIREWSLEHIQYPQKKKKKTDKPKAIRSTKTVRRCFDDSSTIHALQTCPQIGQKPASPYLPQWGLQRLWTPYPNDQKPW